MKANSAKSLHTAILFNARINLGIQKIYNGCYQSTAVPFGSLTSQHWCASVAPKIAAHMYCSIDGLQDQILILDQFDILRVSDRRDVSKASLILITDGPGVLHALDDCDCHCRRDFLGNCQ